MLYNIKNVKRFKKHSQTTILQRLIGKKVHGGSTSVAHLVLTDGHERLGSSLQVPAEDRTVPFEGHPLLHPFVEGTVLWRLVQVKDFVQWVWQSGLFLVGGVRCCVVPKQDESVSDVVCLRLNLQVAFEVLMLDSYVVVGFRFLDRLGTAPPVGWRGSWSRGLLSRSHCGLGSGLLLNHPHACLDILYS